MSTSPELGWHDSCACCSWAARAREARRRASSGASAAARAARSTCACWSSPALACTSRATDERRVRSRAAGSSAAGGADASLLSIWAAPPPSATSCEAPMGFDTGEVGGPCGCGSTETSSSWPARRACASTARASTPRGEDRPSVPHADASSCAASWRTARAGASSSDRLATASASAEGDATGATAGSPACDATRRRSSACRSERAALAADSTPLAAGCAACATAGMHHELGQRARLLVPAAAAGQQRAQRGRAPLRLPRPLERGAARVGGRSARVVQHGLLSLRQPRHLEREGRAAAEGEGLLLEQHGHAREQPRVPQQQPGAGARVGPRVLLPTQLRRSQGQLPLERRRGGRWVEPRGRRAEGRADRQGRQPRRPVLQCKQQPPPAGHGAVGGGGEQGDVYGGGGREQLRLGLRISRVSRPLLHLGGEAGGRGQADGLAPPEPLQPVEHLSPVIRAGALGRAREQRHLRRRVIRLDIPRRLPPACGALVHSPQADLERLDVDHRLRRQQRRADPARPQGEQRRQVRRQFDAHTDETALARGAESAAVDRQRLRCAARGAGGHIAPERGGCGAQIGHVVRRGGVAWGGDE
eukprot:scaffold14896_cov111-Isochrysis_galbana.AAC.1